jgi:hypothetical protein
MEPVYVVIMEVAVQSLGSCARFAFNYSEILEEELTGFKLQKCFKNAGALHLLLSTYFFFFFGGTIQQGLAIGCNASCPTLSISETCICNSE